MNRNIPEGWQRKKLGELGKCIRGLTYSPDDVSNSGLLVLRSSNIQDGRLSLEDNVYVDTDLSDEFYTREGDVLICVRNGSRPLLGKSIIIRNLGMKATHGAFMTIFRSELNDFLQHFIKSDLFFKQVSLDIGATINSINNSNLLHYELALPTRNEQQKIAAILTAVDEVIEKTQLQINKLQDLKKATMNDLLTKGIGHTEFKVLPIIPPNYLAFNARPWTLTGNRKPARPISLRVYGLSWTTQD